LRGLPIDQADQQMRSTDVLIGRPGPPWQRRRTAPRRGPMPTPSLVTFADSDGRSRVGFSSAARGEAAPVWQVGDGYCLFGREAVGGLKVLTIRFIGAHLAK
jgi:hypothetical protein